MQVNTKYLLLSGSLLSTFTILSNKATAQVADSIVVEGSIMSSSAKEIKGAIITHPEFNIQTESDEQGNFSLKVPKASPFLLITATGYASDTLKLEGVSQDNLFAYLKSVDELEKVVYSSTVKSTRISTLGYLKTEEIGSKELMKAACCNLSESFETTPSVDVGFTDAVSGYKQIQMLGLTGSHTLFTRENIPDVRGIAAITGLTFTPGSFVESMQLSKGTGSVVNGFEGTAGQINVEWHKPFEDKTPTWHLNGYQSVQGRSEGNVVYNKEINKYLSTNLLIHGKSNWMNLDQNKDKFLDQPKGETYVVSNRWFYFSPKNIEIQGGVKGTLSTNKGGELNYFTQKENPNQYWSYLQDLKRGEAWAKIGYMNPSKKWQSMGLQLSGVYHDQETHYGSKNYGAEQTSFYANYIYQSIISNTNHVIKGGASFIYDNIKENYATPVLMMNFERKEIVPGAFAEYSYNYMSKFNLVAGLRADYHNLYGFFATPRLHFRYAPSEFSAIRASIGRAQRTANIFAENFAHMASNRQLLVNGANNTDKPYGLNPEIAWNMGLNFTQNFKLGFREGTLSMDYYYTHFQDQVVVDIENPTQVRFYNLDGKSFAHSFQTQVDYELIPRLDLRLAYRFYDVKTTYSGELLEKALISKHRAFVNLGYATRNKWKFDATFQVFGPKRMPMHGKSETLVLASHQTDPYTVLNAQISKTFGEDIFEIYLGAENIIGNMQHHMILMSENTASPYFDASLVWGQAMGRNVYLGFRYNIPKKNKAPSMPH